MADVQFEDAYVAALKAAGITDVFAFRSPDGAVYYGSEPKKSVEPGEEGGYEPRVSEEEEDTPTDEGTTVPDETESKTKEVTAPDVGGGNGGPGSGGPNDPDAPQPFSEQSTDKFTDQVMDRTNSNKTISGLKDQNLSIVGKALGWTAEQVNAMTADDMVEAMDKRGMLAEGDRLAGGYYGESTPTGNTGSGTGTGTSTGTSTGDTAYGGTPNEGQGSQGADTGPGSPGNIGPAGGPPSGDAAAAAAGNQSAPGGENLAQGGPVAPDANDPPVQPGQNPGTADNLTKNLSEGEFVIPHDVVQRLGTQYFEKLIEGTRAKSAQQDPQQQQGQNALRGQTAQTANVQPASSSGKEGQPTATGKVAMPAGTGMARRTPAL